jgi:hypothetical protein
VQREAYDGDYGPRTHFLNILFRIMYNLGRIMYNPTQSSEKLETNERKYNNFIDSNDVFPIDELIHHIN